MKYIYNVVLMMFTYSQLKTRQKEVGNISLQLILC